MLYRLIAGLVLLAGLVSGAAARRSVVELTDDNFDENTSKGVWMIKIYAPWCPHCQHLEPLWRAFAEEVDDVRVGKINGVTERALMARFRISAFPAIYLLRDGRTYQYEGARAVAAFRAFATSGYKTANSLPFHRAPNSILGRAIGRLYRMPYMITRAYRILHDKHGFSDTSIVLGFLTLPVALGGILICLLDAFYVRRARVEVGPEHEHQE